MKWMLAGLLSLTFYFAFSQTEFKKEITGKINRNVFTTDEEVKLWFAKEYNAYHPNDSLLAQIKEVLDTSSKKNITVVLGTWCSDSQTEIPRLLKVLDAINFPKSAVKYFVVDKQKEQPEKIVTGYDIKNVPTIIVYGELYEQQYEAGRIIEHPAKTMEQDLLNLFLTTVK